MSYSLFLDTCQNVINLLVFNEQNEVLATCHKQTNKNMTEIIIDEIKELLKKCQLTSNDICKIYYTNGPGSFTGQRVGSIIAKTWKTLNNVKLYSLNTLALQLPKGSGISIIDAKSQRFYVAVYDNFKNLCKPQIVNLQELNNIKEKFSHLLVFKDDANVEIINNFLNWLPHFKEITSIKLTELHYLKKVIN